MNYSDKDILDLLDDLQGIGAAETPAEEAARAVSRLLWGITLDQGSRILTDNKIPHTFYTASWSINGGNYRTNWILVRRLTVFYDNGSSSGVTSIHRSPEEIKGSIRTHGKLLISEAHFTDAKRLPKPR